MRAPLYKNDFRAAREAKSGQSFDRLAELVQRYLDCEAAVLSVSVPLTPIRHVGAGNVTSRCAGAAFRSGCEIAKIDLRTLTNPLVAGEMGMHFYAGLPLRDHQGRSVGMLAAMDQHERTLAPEELQALKLLAGMAGDLYETQRLGLAA